MIYKRLEVKDKANVYGKNKRFTKQSMRRSYPQKKPKNTENIAHA